MILTSRANVERKDYGRRVRYELGFRGGVARTLIRELSLERDEAHIPYMRESC